MFFVLIFGQKPFFYDTILWGKKRKKLLPSFWFQVNQFPMERRNHHSPRKPRGRQLSVGWGRQPRELLALEYEGGVKLGARTTGGCYDSGSKCLMMVRCDLLTSDICHFLLQKCYFVVLHMLKIV